MRNALVDEGNKFSARAVLLHPCRPLRVAILDVLLQFLNSGTMLHCRLRRHSLLHPPSAALRVAALFILLEHLHALAQLPHFFQEVQKEA